MTKETAKNTALLNRLMTANEDITTKHKVERLGLTIELRGLRTKEINKIRQSATYQEVGKEPFVDEQELMETMLKEAIVGPAELFDEELWKHYEVNSISGLLESMLLAGEYQSLLLSFSEVNGISADEIEEAKN